MRFLDRFRRSRQVRNVGLEDGRIFPPSEPFTADFVERLRDHCADCSEITAAYLYETRFPSTPGRVEGPTLGLVFSNPIVDERSADVLVDASVHFHELLDREHVPPDRPAVVVFLVDDDLASVTEAVTPFFERSGSRSPAS